MPAVLKTLVIILLLCGFGVFAAAFAGPIGSGALFMLLPTGMPPTDHDLPDSYSPLHKGHVDLATGLYIREDEDLVVHGMPALILRRTYLSNYRVSKQFGVGTTHNGEWALTGDGEHFQWASLILADGGRVEFRRVSAGTSLFNAMYEHHSTPGEWHGSRLGWTGLGWGLRRGDGTLAVFQGCGPVGPRLCSIIKLRDPDGHTINYHRDAAGRLLKMEARSNRWMKFDYDGKDRISRAYDSNGHEVRYEYDENGRLTTVTASEGTVRRYTYTKQDQMATINDPATTIENAYDDNGRCVRQVNRFPGDAAPYTFDFSYRITNGAVVQSDMSQSDGNWSRYTFGDRRYTTSETWGHKGAEPAVFTYERDPQNGRITALTLTCPDRSGRPLRHASLVRPNQEDSIKWDLLQTHCSWRTRTPAQPAGSARIGPSPADDRP
jgi:YD repeat-containing protein